MLKYILGSLVALVAVLGIALAIVIPKLVPWAEKEVRAAVKRECKTCEFSMGAVSVSWDGLVLADLHLAGGEKGGQWVDFKARRVVLSPVLRTLFSETPHLRGVTFDTPEIVFNDGEKKSKSSSGGGELDGSKVAIDEIFFFNGVFTYVRDVKGTHAVLRVHDIDGDIDPNPEHAVANVRAQIGKAGRVDLVVTSPYMKRPLEVDCALQVHEQNLADLSVFFKPNAGVELTGTLTKGNALSKLRGIELSTSLFAEYKDFKLRVDKMYDRNDVQTFFTNLGASIAMREKNKNAAKDDKMQTVNLRRESSESLVSFILRGLKEAALAIAI